MTDRTETVGVRVTPGEREKFEEFLEDSNEFDSISRFFRVIAHRHIATDDEDVSIDQDEIIEAVDTAIDPLSERLGKVEEHIVAIDSNVSNDDKIDKLARDIYSSLPTYQDISEVPDVGSIEQYSDMSELALAQRISTPYLWSQYYDEDVADVRRACARMLEYFPDVEYNHIDTGEGQGVPSHGDMDITQEPSSADSHTDFSSTASSDGKSVDSERVDVSYTSGKNAPELTAERQYYKTGES